MGWYDVWAPVYDSVLEKIFYFDRKRAIQYLNAQKGEHILELGVGTGLNLPLYSESVHVTGVDLSKAMISRAKKKHTKASVILQKADAQKLPFSNGEFDRILATFFFRVAPHEAVSEAYRVLKKNGTLVVVDILRSDSGTDWDSLTGMLGWGKNLPDDLFQNFETERSVLIGKATRVLILRKR